MADKTGAQKIINLENLPLRSVAEKGLPALYYQLADVFRRRIEDGEWQVDAQIPTLDQLVAEFHAARATVRQALTILTRTESGVEQETTLPVLFVPMTGEAERR